MEWRILNFHSQIDRSGLPGEKKADLVPPSALFIASMLISARRSPVARGGSENCNAHEENGLNTAWQVTFRLGPSDPYPIGCFGSDRQEWKPISESEHQ